MKFSPPSAAAKSPPPAPPINSPWAAPASTSSMVTISGRRLATARNTGCLEPPVAITPPDWPHGPEPLLRKRLATQPPAPPSAKSAACCGPCRAARGGPTSGAAAPRFRSALTGACPSATSVSRGRERRPPRGSRPPTQRHHQYSRPPTQSWRTARAPPANPRLLNLSAFARTLLFAFEILTTRTDAALAPPATSGVTSAWSALVAQLDRASAF